MNPSALCMPVWNVQAGMGHRPTPHLIGEGGCGGGGEKTPPLQRPF